MAKKLPAEVWDKLLLTLLPKDAQEIAEGGMTAQQIKDRVEDNIRRLEEITGLFEEATLSLGMNEEQAAVYTDGIALLNRNRSLLEQLVNDLGLLIAQGFDAPERAAD